MKLQPDTRLLLSATFTQSLLRKTLGGRAAARRFRLWKRGAKDSDLLGAVLVQGVQP